MARTIIKVASKQDFKNIFALMKELWPNKKLDFMRQEARYLKSRDQGIYLLATQGQKVVGFASLRTVIPGFIAVIDYLVVSRKYRKKGYGKKLLMDLIRYAREKKTRMLFLISAPYRKAAYQFYRMNGFRGFILFCRLI